MAMPRVILLMLFLNMAVVLGGVVTNYLLLKPLLHGGPAPAAAAPAAPGGEAQAGTDGAIAEVAAGAEGAEEPGEYTFFPVQKVIVSLRGEQGEHYFVLDLVLQAEAEADKKKLEQADPMVRSSAVAYLSSLKFEELRALPIPELQGRLETALLADFAGRKVLAPFQHVLVSKMLVQ
ncbi:flagellar basal body-associated protein FliL [Pseudomonas alcaligenes]|uniref:Flagellar protein FliL n=1 Tax=Aquipseudomonas alcaligenes TaxID=43263 RepID=A0ABR7RYP1_AQUAC|nr:flagellar basal body-associated FliL family protein [Pseudomonas alcaligenes]MBC9249839.1 flagellar basal body-associated protein FliL [Pseudomonas alcaligenes]